MPLKVAIETPWMSVASASAQRTSFLSYGGFEVFSTTPRTHGSSKAAYGKVLSQAWALLFLSFRMSQLSGVMSIMTSRSFWIAARMRFSSGPQKR